MKNYDKTIFFGHDVQDMYISYLSYGYLESIASTMLWNRHGISLKLPHLILCLSVNDWMAVVANWDTSLICFCRDWPENQSIIKWDSNHVHKKRFYSSSCAMRTVILCVCVFIDTGAHNVMWCNRWKSKWKYYFICYCDKNLR